MNTALLFLPTLTTYLGIGLFIVFLTAPIMEADEDFQTYTETEKTVFVTSIIFLWLLYFVATFIEETTKKKGDK